MDITALNNELDTVGGNLYKSKFVIKTVTANYTFASGEAKTVTASVRPDSGYSVVGVVGFSNDNVSMSPIAVFMQSSTTCRTDFYNTTGASQSGTFTWKVLTIKTS